MEHHSNLVPWQLVAQMTGARIRAVPVTGTTCSTWTPWTGWSCWTRMAAVSAMSNVLGTVNPVAEIARRAHAAGALVLADAAQASLHAGPGWTTWGSTSSGSPATRRPAPWGSGCWPPARSCWTAWSRSSAGAR